MQAKYLLSALALAVLTACNSDSKDPIAIEPPPPAVQTPSGLSLSFIGRYSTGEFAVSAAEINAYDADSKRAFVVNAQSGKLDVLYLTDPANPVYLDSIDVNSIVANATVNSVAVSNGLVAVAIEASPKTERGYVAVYDAADLTLRDTIEVGALPDMLTFTPDGNFILVANEGEPSDDYQIDPEGSVSIINVSNPDNLFVTTADFRAFNSKRAELLAAGVRLFGPNASVAQDLEPEYIAVSADSKTAWVALQENNALAVLDIASATITDILPLGYKDHGAEGNGFDASDTLGSINISTWPGIKGMYHPDAIASYTVNGATYIVSANEGDARPWGETNTAYWAGDASQGFVEEIRFKHLFHRSGFARRVSEGDMPPQLMQLAAGALLNPDVFAYCGATVGNPGDCREDDLLGRLTVAWTDGYRKHADGTPVLFTADGVEDAGGDRLMYDAVYAYGGRSFAIWSATGELVWDSGDFFEQYLASSACKLGSARDIPCASYFNSNHEAGNSFGNRSDNKGPEAEAVTVGSFGNKTFAFVGLERMGGVMVFDISTPAAPTFVDYLNSLENWTANPSTALADVGDLGPEGITFVSAEHSPNAKPLLIISNEVSGTTAIYQIDLTY